VQRVFLLPERCGRGLWCSPAGARKWLQLGVGARVAEVFGGQFWHGCLVDANLRSPGLNAQFATGECVWADRCAPQARADSGRLCAAAVRPEVVAGQLWLARRRWQSLLSSDRMRREMTNPVEFGLVLIDTPAISRSNDATVWGGLRRTGVACAESKARGEEARCACSTDLRWPGCGCWAGY